MDHSSMLGLPVIDLPAAAPFDFDHVTIFT